MNQDKAKAVVKSLIAKSCSRLKQELEGENDEAIDRLLQQFRAKISRYVWKMVQKGCKFNDDGPVLMPDYTRIYYKKGDTEVVLQEFPPQVRILKFKGSLVNRENSSQTISADKMASVHHFSLALPYVVFVFKFVKGVFSEVKCAFCDRPLKRLEEQPCRPYLSNIDTLLGVCLGSSFDRSQLQPGNITQQIALVLDHFWHSAFSDEWSVHFWNTRASGDAKLASLEAWQAASEDNPLFVVEDARWLPFQEGSFGDILAKMLEGDRADYAFQEEFYNGLTEEFLTELKSVYSNNVGTLATQVPDQMVESLTQELISGLR